MINVQTIGFLKSTSTTRRTCMPSHAHLDTVAFGVYKIVIIRDELAIFSMLSRLAMNRYKTEH